LPGPPLDAFTSDALAGRAERNNAIYGRCWCVSYHPQRGRHRINPGKIRQDRVHPGRARAPPAAPMHGPAADRPARGGHRWWVRRRPPRRPGPATSPPTGPVWRERTDGPGPVGERAAQGGENRGLTFAGFLLPCDARPIRW